MVPRRGYNLVLLFSTALSAHIDLQRRQTTTLGPTCGYHDGDANQPRTAGPAIPCRIDTQNGLWGFCTTTVNVVTDCGFNGWCIDQASCSTGCGPFPSRSDISTVSCNNHNFCSFALLTEGAGQTYTYIACGATAKTDHFLAFPITTGSSTTSTSSSQSSSSSPTSTAAPASSPPASTPLSTSTSASTSTPSQAGNQNSTGPIVGGVVGGLAIICLTVFAIFFLRRNKARRVDRDNILTETTGEPATSGQKPRFEHWDSSYGPVELSTAHLDRQQNLAPVELPSHSDPPRLTE